MALPMLTPPKPPASSASISPPAAVLEIAPFQVWQGCVRLHGLASLPTPDTQVRVGSCALAGLIPKPNQTANSTPKMSIVTFVIFIVASQMLGQNHSNLA